MFSFIQMVIGAIGAYVSLKFVWWVICAQILPLFF